MECKCHGVSGSCEMKTCWKSMPTFGDIGQVLKEKFDGATEVQSLKIGSRQQLVPRNADFKPHTSSDLVYLVPSPDFCEEDLKVSILCRSKECLSDLSERRARVLHYIVHQTGMSTRFARLTLGHWSFCLVGCRSTVMFLICENNRDFFSHNWTLFCLSKNLKMYTVCYQ